MKKFLIAGIVVVAIIVIAVLVMLGNLNSLVAKIIEKQGSEVTQTSVRVAGVDIGLREGRGSIKGLEIASPSGYAARTAFSLGDIVIEIDIQSLRGDPIVINEVRVQAPVVRAEVTKTGDSNIEDLRKRVESYTAATGGGGGSTGPAKRVRIERFIFEKGRVEVDGSALGLEKRTMDLPEIRLEGVGGPAGVPPDQIAKVILETVARRTTSEIASSEIDRLIKEKLGGGSITDKAKGLIEKIGK